MELVKLNKLVDSYFDKTAQSGSYRVIRNVFRAARDIISAVEKAKSIGSSDTDVETAADKLARTAGRLLYNVDKYGLSAQTAAKYATQLSDMANSLTQSIAQHDYNPYGNNIYALTSFALDGFKNSLSNFVPVSMPAMNPSAGEGTTPVQTPIKSPLEKAKEFERQLATQQKQQEEVERGLAPGGVVSLGPQQQTIPGPGGQGRVPAQETEVGVGVGKPKEESFQWPPAGNIGEPSFAPDVELLNEEEKSRRPWEI